MSRVSQHLLRIDGRYYYRQRVPLDLVSIFNRKEIRKALGTACPKMARRIANRLRGIVDSQFNDFRKMSEDEQKWKDKSLELQAKIIAIQKEIIKEKGITLDLRTQVNASDLLAREKENDELALQKAEAEKTVEHLTGALTHLAKATTDETHEKLYSEYLEQTINEDIQNKTKADMTEEERANLESVVRHKTAGMNIWLLTVGDKPIDTYTRDDVRKYKWYAEKLPNNLGKSPSHKDMTADQLIELPNKKYGQQTLKKQFGYIKSVFNTAAREIPTLNLRIFDGITLNGLAPESRKVWTIEQLCDLFNSPIWTGRKGRDHRQTYHEGKNFYKDVYFWMPILGIYTGMRREELCKLRVADFQERDGIPFITVNDEFGRLKTGSSIREVPIHPDLYQFGLKDLLMAAKEDKDGRIFFELKRGPLYKWGEQYSKEFGIYRKKVGIYEHLRDFHALRHTFASYLYDSTREILQISAICGHSLDEIDDLGKLKGKGFTVQTTNYIHIDLKSKYEAIQQLRFDGLDLSHLAKKGRR